MPQAAANPHRARRLALQGLCCLDVQGQKVLDLVESFVQDSHEQPSTIEVAKRFCHETFDQRETMDDLLKRHARNWDLRRLALVDRNILRLACCELCAGSLGVKIIISEALKLAHEFSSAESPRFINGILDAVAREISSEISE